MNSAERKGLTHPIVPGVQRIMRAQSEPIRIYALIELNEAGQPLRFTDLHEGISRSIGAIEGVPASSLSHILTELGDALLIQRQRGVSRITPLGSEAVEAQREYQAALSHVLISSERDRLVPIVGADLATSMSQTLLENSRTRIFRPILDIMHLQSDNIRMNILLVLTEGVMDFQTLGNAVSSRVEKEHIPGSTLSNLISSLEQRELLKRVRHGEFQLTDLGAASIEAYDNYQERLIQPLVNAVMAQYERDLGISIPSEESSPQKMDPARSVYPLPFETMLEYAVRTTH